MNKLESDYQKYVLERLREMFPGCELIKNDSGYLQGIPDWTLLWRRYWAMLEIKRDLKSRRQPNQPYYIEKFNTMSFAAFICPENEEEVLSDLQHAFQPRRKTRAVQR